MYGKNCYATCLLQHIGCATKQIRMSTILQCLHPDMYICIHTHKFERVSAWG